MLTEEQKALRRTGVGGSEIAAVCGLDPYKTPLDVYLAKVEGWEQMDNAAMERGRFLEDGVANWYAHRTGATLTSPGTVRHPSRPVALCTPDRIATHVVEGRTGQLDLSIKVPGPYVRESWGEAFTDDVPQTYLFQLQWELLILGPRELCGTACAHLAAPIDGDLRVYAIWGDAEMQGVMLTEAERFWRDYVEPKRPPPLDGSASCTAWLGRRFPRDSRPVLEADLPAEVLGFELREAELAREAAEEREEAAVNRFKEVIGDTAGVRGTFGKVTWKADKNGKRSFRRTWRKA